MGRTSAPDERLRRHRARARLNGSCPELRPNQRPGGRQANRIARRDEPYDAVVASLLPAPLRKRCHGVIPALRAVLTPGLASLARRERSARLPGERAAWPNRLLAAGSRTACQEDGHPRSRLAARRAATARRRAACRAPCRVGGRSVLLAGACGRRPLGRFAPAASEASPDVSTDRRSGMTSCAPLPKRRREERSDDRVMRFVQLARRVHLSSSWSWVRLHALGSQRRADRPSPVSSWHRARCAMSGRRRVALVDGSEPLGRALIHTSRVSAR